MTGACAPMIPSIWPTTTEYVLLEALGLGKAVVTFNAGIHREVIRDGDHGFSVTCGDTDAFAERLNLLAADDMLADRIGRQGRQLFDSMCDPAGYRDAFQAALSRIELPIENALG